jgi:hypothetical protein
MEITRYDCVKIAVDCVKNKDKENIKNGGPKIIGFDFFVKESDAKDIMKFIVVALSNLEVPLMKIGIEEKLTLTEQNICTKEKILESINGQAELIKAEARRNKGTTPRM